MQRILVSTNPGFALISSFYKYTDKLSYYTLLALGMTGLKLMFYLFLVFPG